MDQSEDIGQLPKTIYAVRVKLEENGHRRTLVRLFAEKDKYEAFVKRMTDHGMVGDAEVTTHEAALVTGTKARGDYSTQWQDTGTIQEKARIVPPPKPAKKRRAA